MEIYPQESSLEIWLQNHTVKALVVPWPRDLVAKFQASFLASKLPLDHDSIAVHTAVPGKCFFAQEGSISDPTSAQALSGIEADLNFRLIEPTAVFASVVHGEPIPQPSAFSLAEALN